MIAQGPDLSHRSEFFYSCFCDSFVSCFSLGIVPTTMEGALQTRCQNLECHFDIHSQINIQAFFYHTF
jgi:hypothetical protein